MDSQVIPAIKNQGKPQDYDDSEFPGGTGGGGGSKQPNDEAEPLDAKSEKEAQPLIEIFGDSTG